MAVRDVEIQGRTFRIRPFAARDGSQVVLKLVGIIGAVQPSGNEAADGVALMGAIGSLPPAEFEWMQSKCLGCVDEHMGDRGYTPILHPDGQWAVVGLEDATPLVVALTLEVATGALADFFSAGQRSQEATR